MMAFNALVVAAASFCAPAQPLASRGFATSGLALHAKSTTARAAPVVASEAALADAIRVVAALPTMYVLMSLNEYATHRYFQHLEFNRPESLQWLKGAITQATGSDTPPKLKGDGHVEHHAETYDDMSLKNDERWRRTPASRLLDDDEFRGTAFHWTATGIMTLQMLPSVLPTYALMGWSVPQTLAILLPSMLLHALVWNAIHPPMHGLPQVTAADGAPSDLLLKLGLADTPYFSWIFENHMGHHVLGGQVSATPPPQACCPHDVKPPLRPHLKPTPP